MTRLALGIAFLATVGPVRADEVSFQGALEWITSTTALVRAGHDGNRGNALGLPDAILGTELRPRLELQLGAVSVVARPRFTALWQYAAEGLAPRGGEYGVELIEGYARWSVTPTLAVAFGVQNYQWGPAEVAAPSNRLFRQSGLDVTPLTVWHGRTLLRVNASFGDLFSAVLMVEPVDFTGAPPGNAGQEFAPRAQLKVEVASPRGDAYLGVTAGDSTGRAREYVGSYAMWDIGGGLSIYYDAVHERGSETWVAPPGSGLYWRRRPPRLRSLAVAGARYTWTSGTDLRVEAIHQDTGWSASELHDSVRLASLLAPAAAAYRDLLVPWLLGPYALPGVELPGRDFAYASLRVPDLGADQMLTISLRSLLSLGDGSLGTTATFECNLSGSTVLTLYASGSLGPRGGELTRLYRAAAQMALRMSW